MDENQRIRLITRGDDLGVFRAGNRAIVDAFQHGILRNSSLMVPAPNFLHAASLVKHLPGLCLGLHITLTSEWDNPRWGPVSPPEMVSSLVDHDHSFFRTAQEIFEHGINLEEALHEVKAQLALARSYGLDIRYLDEHMGVGWLFNPTDMQRWRLNKLLRALAHEEGLIWYEDIGSQGQLKSSLHELLPSLRQLKAGSYTLITHPAYADAEIHQALGQLHTQPGALERERLSDYQILCEPEIMQIVRERHIEVTRYDELSF